MEKETDLIKDNIIKDRRRRYLYLSKDRQSGLQVMESELPKFTILKKMSLWAVLVFIIPFGIFKLSLTLSLGLALAVYFAGTLYFNLVVLKNRTSIALTPTELTKLDREDLIKAERSNSLSEVLVPLFVVLIIVSRAIDPKAPLTGADTTIAKLAIAFLTAYAVYLFPTYLKHRKRYKQFKK